MVARKKPAKRTRRRKQKLNLINATEAVIQSSIVTRAFFGIDVIPFLTEGWLTAKTPSGIQSGKSAWTWMGAGGGAGSSWGISLAEIFQYAIPGGNTGSVDTFDGSMPQQIMANLRSSAIPALVSSTLTNIGFRVIKRVTRKQRRQVNKGIKALGLSKDVTV